MDKFDKCDKCADENLSAPDCNFECVVDNCKTCKENESDQCEKCDPGFFGVDCKPCGNFCNECDDAENCTTCMEDPSGNPEANREGKLCQCPNGFRAKTDGTGGDELLDCVSTCKVDNCNKCANDDNQKCIDCETGYFGDSCDACPDFCDTCSSSSKCTDCTASPNGKGQREGDLCTCPTGFFT